VEERENVGWVAGVRRIEGWGKKGGYNKAVDCGGV